MSQVYRQVAHILRIPQGPGTPDRVSQRPRAGSRAAGWGAFTDGDDAPTLIEFTPADLVDVAFLLKIGAITVHAPAAPERKGGGHGK